MATKLPGARRALDYMEADLKDIIEHCHEPGLVEKLARACLRRLSEDFDPLLNRAAPSIERQLEDITDRLEKLEAESATRKVLQFEQHRKANQ
jgi:plasmid stabilization system protein ParE